MFPAAEDLSLLHHLLLDSDGSDFEETYDMSSHLEAADSYSELAAVGGGGEGLPAVGSPEPSAAVASALGPLAAGESVPTTAQVGSVVSHDTPEGGIGLDAVETSTSASEGQCALGYGREQGLPPASPNLCTTAEATGGTGANGDAAAPAPKATAAGFEEATTAAEVQAISFNMDAACVSEPNPPRVPSQLYQDSKEAAAPAEHTIVQHPIASPTAAPAQLWHLPVGFDHMATAALTAAMAMANAATAAATAGQVLPASPPCVASTAAVIPAAVDTAEKLRLPVPGAGARLSAEGLQPVSSVVHIVGKTAPTFAAQVLHEQRSGECARISCPMSSCRIVAFASDVCAVKCKNL